MLDGFGLSGEVRYTVKLPPRDQGTKANTQRRFYDLVVGV